jgi:hypothetical protein
MNEVTLQINLSAGDINYAALTVPALVKNHTDINNRLLVIDCCRPQKTKIVDPDLRFPKDKFEQRLKQIVAISEQLLNTKTVTQVYYLCPDDPIIDKLSKLYLRGLYKTTHAAGGTGNMSYWVGFELPETKYVLHYDGDILLYQKPGYSWVNEAVRLLDRHPEALFAVPRLCPPVISQDLHTQDMPSLHEGRPLKTFSDHWENDWFSTRYFLCDRYKLKSYLPLVRGKVMIELLLRKYGRRAFPIDPEILMFKSMSPRNAKRIVLKNQNAWTVHPVDKSDSFIEALPVIISLLELGIAPPDQHGYEDMKLQSWLELIRNRESVK